MVKCQLSDGVIIQTSVCHIRVKCHVIYRSSVWNSLQLSVVNWSSFG